MIIAMTVLFDDGDFAVHYAAAKTLAQAQTWCESRKANLKKQGMACSSAVIVRLTRPESSISPTFAASM